MVLRAVFDASLPNLGARVRYDDVGDTEAIVGGLAVRLRNHITRDADRGPSSVLVAAAIGPVVVTFATSALAGRWPITSVEPLVAALAARVHRVVDFPNDRS